MLRFTRKLISKIDPHIPLLLRIGLFFNHKHKPPTATRAQIQNMHYDDYLGFIKDIYKEEEERKTVIESKSSQLLSQSGIVLSLIAIIIPLVSTSIKELNTYSIATIIILFCLAVVLYVNTIYHTALLTRVQGWSYMQPSQSNIELINPTADDFKNELINDYYQSYMFNLDTNNQKADYLNYSANSYTLATLVSAALIIITCVFLLFPTKNNDSNTKLTNINNYYNIYNEKLEKDSTLHMANTLKKTQHKTFSNRPKIKQTKYLNIKQKKHINDTLAPDSVPLPCPCR